MMTETFRERPALNDSDGLCAFVRSIRWARLTLTLRAEQPVSLPPYAGSTFRGAFGHAFKRVACPLRRECEGCGYRDVCVYAYVFETPGNVEGSSLTRGATVAHPFVLEPPEGPTGEVRPGEAVTLGLVLVGRAIPLAPYFLAACREMVQRGLGRGRGRLRLERAVADDPVSEKGRVVYDGDRDLLAPAVPPWRWDDLRENRRAEDRVTLRFVTPTRLRQDADLVVRPEFATLATALLRRLTVLVEAHCGGKADLDAKAILESAKTVHIEKSELRWHDWERYSARQDARMTLGGFVGRITFAGLLAPWMPLLTLGEFLHVGKGTAFGLGKYRMEGP
jgi:hypothetical protein